MFQWLYKSEQLRHELKLAHTKAVSDLVIAKNEEISSVRMENDRQIQRMKTDYETKLLEFKSKHESIVKKLDTEHAVALAEFKSKTAGEFYERLKTEFTDLQKDGDKNSKFIQELALKIMEKAPPATTRLEYVESKKD